MEITQIERCRAARGAGEEEWCWVQTGAALGHIRSWWREVELAQSRIDADEVTGRHADATVGSIIVFLEKSLYETPSKATLDVVLII